MILRPAQFPHRRGTQVVGLQVFCLSEVKYCLCVRATGWGILITLPWNFFTKLCYLTPVSSSGLVSDYVTSDI